MSATTYTADENRWTWTGRSHGHRFDSPLYLTWELWNDPITDNYTPDEASAHDLLRSWLDSLPDERTEELFGPGAVGIGWSVTGEPFEAAPFQMRRYRAGDEDFLTHYTWPEQHSSGERLNFNRLPVKDKLWRPGAADKGGFFQEATGWKPAALQPVAWVGATLAAAGLSGPAWQPREFGPARA
jgi:hypothetical protein